MPASTAPCRSSGKNRLGHVAVLTVLSIWSWHQAPAPLPGLSLLSHWWELLRPRTPVSQQGQEMHWTALGKHVKAGRETFLPSITPREVTDSAYTRVTSTPSWPPQAQMLVYSQTAMVGVDFGGLRAVEERKGHQTCTLYFKSTALCHELTAASRWKENLCYSSWLLQWSPSRCSARPSAACRCLCCIQTRFSTFLPKTQADLTAAFLLAGARAATSVFIILEAKGFSPSWKNRQKHNCSHRNF